MELRDVKYCLGRRVRFSRPSLGMDDVAYIMDACILQRDSRGELVYTAQLRDTRAASSVIIVPLGKIRKEENNERQD